jgi:hypothetical protein
MAAGAGRARHRLRAARRYWQPAAGKLRVQRAQRRGTLPLGPARAYRPRLGWEGVRGRDRGPGDRRPARHRLVTDIKVLL